MNKKEAAQLVRDMTPYVEILTNIAKYFKYGEDIVIFEIGVRRATSTKAFLDGLVNRIGSGRLYSCDIDDRTDRVIDKKQKELWTFIHGDSQEIEWDKEIDVLMIDGDHSYDGAKNDFQKYEKFVKADGLIIMHDVTNRDCGVRLFWPEIDYPKISLALNGVGLGLIQKKI